MTTAKQEAEREYQQAQVALDRVAKEADRALFTLATSSNDAPVHPIPPPPWNGIITSMPDDVLLPSLPSSDRIKDLGNRLETHNYVILDGFLGEDPSFNLRRDVEALYRASRAHEDGDLPSPPQKEDTLSPPAFAAMDTARFRLGELAGGKTGRNLRYQMAHVRGDYVLWLDEQDAWCPSSVRLVLRQLDRLILERLSQMNHELLMSALLRKKAMVTCYPGENQARYTRHCDNPNSNGRKLTAILYLNPDYESSQGGQLRLELNGDNGVVDIEPRMDRLVLFYSDRRVPHQVLPCHSRDRFALTLWYLDYDEFFNAQVFGASGQDETQEHTRIEKEMKGFEAAKDAPS
ncbi:hypothetical protein Poli38472_002659 [Pythium oligandrum]|uniref:Fe2OG dioxygenase domain-containing protein n=1 Tax=Pythium oligandrum TaxID=41045 RepID=A0A8K1FMJ3_PYTOL|nr:hypothetical protein Poli38472_002659 [Pythium oligandrum]|eukprot:TMW63718.1 hypothetical protein Poli38472_002659 [Pythium oligandrum]